MEWIELGCKGLVVKRFAKVILLVVFVTALSTFPSTPVSAKEPTRGIALSPLRSEYTIAPGASKKTTVNVTNFSSEKTEVTLSVEEFNVTNQEYDYQFNASIDVEKWVIFGKTVLLLNPGQNVAVPLTLAIPKDAEPGGLYISIFATSKVNAVSSSISSQQRVASLYYVTIDGNVTQLGRLVSLSPPFIYDEQTKWSMVIENKGTTHFHSRYTASVQNMFDGSEVAKYTNSALILPDTNRKISESFPLPKFIGIYRIVYTIGLGDKPAVRQERLAIFLPRQYYAPLFTLIIILVVGLIYFGKKRATSKSETD